MADSWHFVDYYCTRGLWGEGLKEQVIKIPSMSDFR